MTWRSRKVRPKIGPRCKDRCWPKEPGTMVYSSEFTGMVYYCRVCRLAVSDFDRMKPKLQLVKSSLEPR